jgi:Type VI immunity for VRR-NUC
MGSVNLPTELATPALVSGKVASKVLLDLTVYLAGPSEQELEHLIDFYETLCPPGRLVKYKIGELEHWPPLARPELTASARIAAAAGIKRPYLEPVRKRIRDGRSFEIQFWDGLSINDPIGCWSFNCRRIHLLSSGLHAFVRLLIPLQEDPEILRRAALTIADNVELVSGHGGLVFVYDAWQKDLAFSAIYAQARRFWGVDVEDLTDTLPLMKKGIKGVNWLTLVGQGFASQPEIQAALADLTKVPGVNVEQRKHGVVLIAGPQPVVGDQHRPDQSLDPYYAVAHALEPLFITAHPDFPGTRFFENGNTIAWIRRFIDPAGWR